MISTPFWYKNPSVLYDRDYIFEIFPSKRFDIIRKLNSLLRLSILYSLIVYLINKDNRYIALPFVVAAVTWIIWSRQTDTHTEDVLKESMSNKLDELVMINDLATECRVPTKDNPFMNPGLNELRLLYPFVNDLSFNETYCIITIFSICSNSFALESFTK